MNARAGYRFENGMRLQLDAYNLFNVKQNQIEYYYEFRLATEPAGVATFDRHLHPVEPLAVRADAGRPALSIPIFKLLWQICNKRPPTAVTPLRPSRDSARH